MVSKPASQTPYSALAFGLLAEEAGIPKGVINVVTGSFNFTKAAEDKNAENVLVLRGNEALAKQYVNNWQMHWAHSQEYMRRF